jgi:signal transduction histidine kinase/CheY-like chemotaxis protein
MTSKNLTSGIDYYSSSPMYTLTLYPTSTLYESFRTDNPIIACVGAILIILFTSMLFFLYDFLVRREFKSKDRLLESKRLFVRFVSHEVRTPLNSVAMGLSLLQDECAFALGYRTSDEMLKNEEYLSQLVPNTSTNTNMITSPTQIDEWRSRMSEWFYLVNEIQNNVESSVDVLNDLLNYDKIETGALSLELTTILIWKLIQKTANEFIGPLAKKKISFKLLFTDVGLSEVEQTESINRSDISLLLPPECKKQRVIGDTVRLTQVFRNLISNAVKFTKEGGEISVRASWIPLKASAIEEKSQFTLKCGSQVMASSCGYIKVKVKDSGAGMSKEQLSQLFQHGVQFNVNELQAGQGSGLGLYIAKGILEGHQGRLYANSEGLGLGSTFTLEIPMYVIEGDNEDTLDGEGTEASFLFSEPSSFRILVVDDSLSNRKLLCRILTNKGHDVEEADDGSEAVAKVKQSLSENRCYDTILLDYEMPIMNGPDAAIQIRALGCDSFIVGVTGNMLPEDVAHFRSCGANALLGKPFKMKSLEDLWYEHNHSNVQLIDNTV